MTKEQLIQEINKLPIGQKRRNLEEELRLIEFKIAINKTKDKMDILSISSTVDSNEEAYNLSKLLIKEDISIPIVYDKILGDNVQSSPVFKEIVKSKDQIIEDKSIAIKLYAHVPNCFIESSVFSTNHLEEYKERSTLSNIKVFSVGSHEVFYTGKQLDMLDLFMFNSCYKMSNTINNQEISLSLFKLCEFIGYDYNKKNRDKIWNSLKCLTTSYFEIPKTFIGSLFSGIKRINDKGKQTDDGEIIIININPLVNTDLLNNKNFTRIEHKIPEKQYLVDWLNNYIERCKCFKTKNDTNINFSTMKELTGRIDMNDSKFQELLISSFKQLGFQKDIDYEITKSPIGLPRDRKITIYRKSIIRII